MIAVTPGILADREFLASQMGTLLGHWDFEQMNVGSYSTFPDLSGNSNAFVPFGNTVAPIVQDGVRRGVSLSPTLTLRQANRTFWKALHDNTTSYTIYIEGRLTADPAPDGILGILGETAGSSVNPGITVWMDNRIASQRRSRGVNFLMSNGTTGVFNVYSEFVFKPGGTFSVIVTFTQNMVAGGVHVYVQGSRQIQADRLATHSTANPNYDLELGSIGNNAANMTGYIYRMAILQESLAFNQRRILLHSRPIQTDYPLVDRKISKVEAATTRYVAFGSKYSVAYNKMFLCVRSGTSHIANGRIDIYEYTPSTDTFAAPRTIATPGAGLDYRTGNGGVVGTQVFVFTSIYTTAGGLWNDIGYFVSTDLNGTSWSSFVSLLSLMTYPTTGTSSTGWLPYGDMVAGPSGEYLMPYYETDGTNYLVGAFRTTDSGANWTKVTIGNRTSPKNTETSIAYMPGVGWLAISRDNNGAQLLQHKSSDGINWTYQGVTNLMTGGTSDAYTHSIPSLKMYRDKICLFWTDRLLGYVRVTVADPATVFASHTAWTTGHFWASVAPSGGPTLNLGYTSVGYSDYFEALVVAWGREDTSAKCVQWYRVERFSAVL